jgi:ribosome-associated protein
MLELRAKNRQLGVGLRAFRDPIRSHLIARDPTRIMIEITDRIQIHEDELVFEFVRSSGPGGQNVNKVSSAVRLRFDVTGSPSLPCDVRERLIRLAGKRTSAEGVLVIQAQRFRTQESNRKDAVARLVAMIRAASERPEIRRPTRPTAGSRIRRLDAKRRRSATKAGRKNPEPAEE